MEGKNDFLYEERTSASLGLRCLDEENTSNSKLELLTLDFDEALSESFIDSTCEADEPIIIQKIPQMKFTSGNHILSKSMTSSNFNLLVAVETNNVSDVIQIITKSVHKPDPNFKLENDNTYLHIAAEKGYLKICESLLDYLEDIHLSARNKDLMQPLHLAAKNGHLQVAQLLVRSGADLNPIDILGNTPLHLACIGGFTPLVSWLMSRGPDTSIENIAGQTPENLASEELKTLLKRSCRKKTVACTGPSMDMERLLALRLKSSNPSYNFTILSQLGKGSFGEVFLVRNSTSQLYALKVLDKEKILNKNLTAYAQTERNILIQMSHPFIVSLVQAFQTSENLFLVLEYCAGGDLSSYLKAEKKFTESRARFYLCEVVLALEELHRNNIIFRDLKPDNIVLDAAGHIKLTDFGLSKAGIDSYTLTNSFCGSVAYLAPEIIKRKGHGKAVDWYLLGALFYEMVIGIPPYFTTSKSEWIANIEKGKLRVPSNLSPQAKELIKDLLQKDPLKRLGTQRGAEEIKNHRFFKGVDWDAVLRKQHCPYPAIISNVPANGVPIEDMYGKIFDSENSRVNGWNFG